MGCRQSHSHQKAEDDEQPLCFTPDPTNVEHLVRLAHRCVALVNATPGDYYLVNGAYIEEQLARGLNKEKVETTDARHHRVVRA